MTARTPSSPARLGASRVLRHRRSAATLVALALALGAAPGCDATITESDLQKWTNNDIGLARITQVVGDPRQPLDTRIRALEVVVEKGFPLRVRGMLNAIDDDADRAGIVGSLTVQLLKHVEKKSKFQLDAKDTLMTLEAYVSPVQWEGVRRAVAEWAFADLTWDTPASEVQEKVQARISSGQIMDLQKHGWQAAGILIKHGYVVDKMVRYLGAAKDPIATEILLKGLRELHAETGAQAYHLEALRSTGSASSLAYLLEMYMNPNLDEEFRAGAFNVAVEMIELPAVKQEPGAVADQLLKLIDTQSPEDRWLGATNLLHLRGAAALDKILAAFKDDKVYAKAEEDPGKSVMDLCLDVHDLGHGAVANPRFRSLLTDGNRIQKAIAIVCLKANNGAAAKTALEQLAKASARDDVSIDDFLGAELTLGKLAKNAVEGLEQIAVLERDLQAGKYTAEQAKTRRLLTVFELELLGDEYAEAVEQRYQAWVFEQQELEKQKKAEAEDAARPPEGAKPDGTPAP